MPKNTRKLLRLFPTEKKDKDAIGQVLVAGEENAGVIDVGDGWGVAFKIESHNHRVRLNLLRVLPPEWEASCVIFSRWVLARFYLPIPFALVISMIRM